MIFKIETFGEKVLLKIWDDKGFFVSRTSHKDFNEAFNEVKKNTEQAAERGLAISAAKLLGIIGLKFHLKGKVMQPTPAG